MNVCKLDKAEDDLKRSLEIFDKTGNRREAAFALNTLGLIEQYRGQYEAACRYADRSLEIRQNLGDPRGVAQTMITKAHILIGKHDFDAALELLAKSGDTSFLINDERGIAEALEQLASLASGQDSHAKAVVLYAAAEGIRKKLHLPLPPVAQQARDARIEGARNALGDTGFDSQWEKGRWMPPLEAFVLGVNRKSNPCGTSDE
jgi:tetratricopeptide (TPR) repeat protein